MAFNISNPIFQQKKNKKKQNLINFLSAETAP